MTHAEPPPDLGCGQGADALWLAEHGWDVLATDVSQVAVERAARQTAGRPGAERISWRQADDAAGCHARCVRAGVDAVRPSADGRTAHRPGQAGTCGHRWRVSG